VQEEAVDELHRFEGQEFLRVVIGRIAPAEGDLAVGEGDEPAVRDGNAVGVMCQILEHVLRTAKRRLDADHPFFGFERTQESVERFWLAQMGQSPRKPEFALSIGSHQPAQESPAKASFEYGHRQEESPPAGDPPGAI